MAQQKDNAEKPGIGTTPENDPEKTREDREVEAKPEGQQDGPTEEQLTAGRTRLGPEGANADLVADPEAVKREEEDDPSPVDGPGQRIAEAQARKGGGGYGNPVEER